MTSKQLETLARSMHWNLGRYLDGVVNGKSYPIRDMEAAALAFARTMGECQAAMRQEDIDAATDTERAA